MARISPVLVPIRQRRRPRIEGGRSQNVCVRIFSSPSTCRLTVIFTELQIYSSVPGVFGNLQNQYLDVIKQMLSASLQPEEEYFVRFQAVKALGAFITMHEKETNIQKHFADLLPNFMLVQYPSLLLLSARLI